MQKHRYSYENRGDQVKHRRYIAYIYIAPAVLLVGILLYYPIIANIIYSFHSFKAYSSNMDFVGLKNYITLFTDDRFYIALRNNLIFLIFNLVFQVGVALVLAILVENVAKKRFGRLCRTIYFIPSLFSITAIAIMWQFIFEPEVGMLNNLFRALNLDSLVSVKGLLGQESTAIYTVAMMPQWQFTGYFMMLLVVAIQKIPEDYYDAAEIDGASKFRQAITITIPMIKEMLLVDIVMTVVATFKSFAEVYQLTMGGPGYSTLVIGMYAYQNAFKYDRMGYSSTIGVIIFLITFIFSVIQLRISNSGGED